MLEISTNHIMKSIVTGMREFQRASSAAAAAAAAAAVDGLTTNNAGGNIGGGSSGGGGGGSQKSPQAVGTPDTPGTMGLRAGKRARAVTAKERGQNTLGENRRAGKRASTAGAKRSKRSQTTS